jgi:hypothetical protein
MCDESTVAQRQSAARFNNISTTYDVSAAVAEKSEFLLLFLLQLSADSKNSRSNSTQFNCCCCCCIN